METANLSTMLGFGQDDKSSERRRDIQIVILNPCRHATSAPQQ
jgi:hypothetical protein